MGALYATGEERRNSSRRNEKAKPKQRQRPVVDVSDDENKVQCSKEQYRIGTWHVRSMNHSKLDVAKHEMARVNIDILGISELNWKEMGEFTQMTIMSATVGNNSLEEMD